MRGWVGRGARCRGNTGVTVPPPPGLLVLLLLLVVASRPGEASIEVSRRRHLAYLAGGLV